MAKWLTQENGFAFRIVHRENVATIFTSGLHARNSPGASKTYVGVGNAELIAKRGSRRVPIAPFGVLNDYVPFYFTPFSPMAFNIRTGHNGIVQRRNDDIVIIVVRVVELIENNLNFVFTDGHAYLQASRYFSSARDLGEIDWALLQNRDFKRDPNDPEKMDRYQAELLVHGSVPLRAVNAIVTFSPTTQTLVQTAAAAADCPLKISSAPGMYF